jgi:drug/metabolite transporter (DMT)-like permease
MSALARPQLLLIGASVSWGTSTVTSKYALEGLTATDLLGIEVGVAAVLLIGLVDRQAPSAGSGRRPRRVSSAEPRSATSGQP